MLRGRLEDAAKLVLRVLVGGVMSWPGADRVLHGPTQLRTDLADHGVVGLLALVGYVGESLAPAFIVAGAWTRIWAVFYALTLGLVTALVHTGDLGHGAPTTFLIASAIVVALLGSGRYALRRGEGPWD